MYTKLPIVLIALFVLAVSVLCMEPTAAETPAPVETAAVPSPPHANTKSTGKRRARRNKQKSSKNINEALIAPATDAAITTNTTLAENATLAANTTLSSNTTMAPGTEVSTPSANMTTPLKPEDLEIIVD